MLALRKLEIDGWDVMLGEGEEEPRVRDVDLAERAGLTRPTNVRTVIAKNRAELEAHGPLCVRTRRVRTQMPGGFAFREADVCETWLNEAQALALVVLLRTDRARELRVSLVRLFVAVRRGLVPAPAPSSVVPISEVHGSRVGDTHARAEVVTWCKLAGLAQGTTLHRVHGALRRQYKVPSVYALSVSVWPTAKAFLEDLALRRVDLPRPAKDEPRPTHLRLVQDTRQVPMPWGR